MDFEKRMRVKSPCMFCANHTHAFPSDDWHEQQHMEGWHTCGIDGVFRDMQPFCPNFEVSQFLMTSF